MEEARRFLRLLLRKNFPELESLKEIDQIPTVDTLEALGEVIVEACGTDAVREAILAAAGQTENSCAVRLLIPSRAGIFPWQGCSKCRLAGYPGGGSP